MAGFLFFHYAETAYASNLIISITIVSACDACIVEDLFVLEETLNLNGSTLQRVAGMYDILLTAHREVATDSTWQSLTAICSTSHLTHYIHSANTFEAHSYNWGTGH